MQSPCIFAPRCQGGHLLRDLEDHAERMTCGRVPETMSECSVVAELHWRDDLGLLQVGKVSVAKYLLRARRLLLRPLVLSGLRAILALLRLFATVDPYYIGFLPSNRQGETLA